MRLLDHARIPELPNPYFGKVRDCYDVPQGRLLIATDRLSAFDRILAVIPWKGQVLSQLSRYWFEETAALCPHHVLAYPDPNVTLGRRLTILPVEIIVRGYLAGTTSTSLLTLYQGGAREAYGHRLPEGLRPHEALPAPLITPTSKAFDGGHDAPLSARDILDQGLMRAAEWDEVSARALALFAHGQALAAERGLILADSKYEFGRDEAGRIYLADELHTPDSSRFWRAEAYEAALAGGTRPPSFDKDVIRAWVAARCDPYKDPIPAIPEDLIAATSAVYIEAYSKITGRVFEPDTRGESPLARIRAALSPYFTQG